jgi:putative glycosyltransferase
VSTLFRSGSTIDEFCRRALAAAETISSDIEVVLVNDGSPDDSLRRALALHETDPRIVVVDLARNFGHHKAMMTGLSLATGDLVFLIDCDLEEEPELLGRFYAHLCAGHLDVVFGQQEMRRGGPLERVTGDLFFGLVNAISDQPLPRNIITARLMTRPYVRALVRHRDREFLIAHLWAITGFRQEGLAVTKHSLSPTTYTVWRRFEMAVRHLTTNSTKLLYAIFYGGLAISATAAAIIMYFVLRYLLGGIGVEGWTSVIVSVWFFGGLLTLILGILGIYVANILSETKRRPYTLVRQIYRRPGLPFGKPPIEDERHRE